MDEVVRRLHEHNYDALVLGFRMQTHEDLAKWAALVERLRICGYNGTVCSFGSTCEYLPIVGRSTYGTIKRAAIRQLSCIVGRTFTIAHVICPSHYVTDGSRVAYAFHAGVTRGEDTYTSLSCTLAICNPNDAFSYRAALRAFARWWYAGTCGVYLTVSALLCTLLLKDLYLLTCATVLGVAPLVYYVHQGMRFPCIGERHDLWRPNGDAALDDVISIPGTLSDTCSTCWKADELLQYSRSLDLIFHSPRLLQAVAAACGRDLYPGYYMGSPPWALSFAAPTKAGYWHVDRVHGKCGHRLILALARSECCDYKLNVSTPVGIKSYAMQNGDLILIGKNQLHQPGPMTRGYRSVGIIDLIEPEEPVAYRLITFLHFAQAAKRIGLQV